jgi:outer membrane protein assembly factor BamB
MPLDEQLRQLAEQVPPAPPSDAAALFRRGVRRRRVRQGASVAAVVVALGAVAVGVSSLGDTPVVPDIADLPPAPTVPDVEESIDVAEPDATSESAGEAVTICAPAGCEVWRRPLRVRHPMLGWVQASPVVIEDDRLVGLELETGAVRWQVELGDELRAREGGPVELPLGGALLVGNDEQIALVNPHGVQLVDQSGQTRWTRALPADGAELRLVQLTATSVVIVHELGPVLADHEELQSGEQFPVQSVITVLDVRDGQLRWSREGPERLLPQSQLAEHEDLVLLDDDGAIVALDVATSEPRYDLAGEPDLWHGYADGILVVGPPGAPSAPTRLVDASDGTVLTELPGTARSMLDIEGRVIVLLDNDEPNAASWEAVAVDPDGTVVWRLPVEPSDDDRCCPSILDLDGRSVRISAGPQAPALVVDVREGTVRSDDPLATTPSVDIVQQEQLGRGLLITYPDNQAGYLVRDGHGRSVQITAPFGSGSRPTHQTSSDLVLIGNDHELIAVRLQ